MAHENENIRRLIDALDAAVQEDPPQGPCQETTCKRVKDALVDTISVEGFELPAEFVRTNPGSYARHLLHKSDDYVVVVMVWAPGQGTPIHDHDEKWCVECVYRGSIVVTSYDLLGSTQDEIVGFRETDEVVAGKGMAGALIPPFDYHVIKNCTEEVAATIHVYGGEMQACHTFAPMEDGRYRRERRELSYTGSC